MANPCQSTLIQSLYVSPCNFSRFYQQNLRSSTSPMFSDCHRLKKSHLRPIGKPHFKKTCFLYIYAHSVWRNEHFASVLLNEASIYPDTTGTIKELAAFWYNFTYIEVPPSLQSLIRNEARLHKTKQVEYDRFYIYIVHVININTCNMFIHIDTYYLYIYIYYIHGIYIYIYMRILCVLSHIPLFCGSNPHWSALWIDRWIQFKNLQKGRERNFQWNFDVAPSQDASGKWRFSSGFPIENVIILVVTATGRGHSQIISF